MGPRDLYRLLAQRRRPVTNWRLGGLLAFVAGAINAGGYLAVHRYTSHVSGVISSVADDLAAANFMPVLDGLAVFAAFLSGAACSAVLINWARRRRMRSAYALALFFEALLLLIFGLFGAHIGVLAPILLPATVLLLGFVMGLQNAILTKVSQAEVRTTHMTGVTTDLGIELGRLMYWNRSAAANRRHLVRANRDRLKVHATVLGLFFLGGVVGASAFKRFGFAMTIPFSIGLIAIVSPSLVADLRRRWGGPRTSNH